MQRYLAYFRKFDVLLFIIVMIIVSFGLAALYSIALSKDIPDFTNFKKQIIFIVIGILLMFIFSLVDYRFWKSYAKYGYMASCLLLVAVLVFGQTIRGTQGWFVFAGFQFQPVEIVKMFLIIMLAYYFSSVSRPLYQTKHVLVSLCFMGMLFALTILQPDLGSAMMLAIIWLGMIFMIGLKRWQWGVLAAVAVLFAIVGWYFVLEDYQKQRVLTLVHPEADVLGEGYAVAQSIIAIGSGKIIGTGLGFGSQSQLKFLPESHTDFIFSVISEELGFLGVGILLIFVALLLLRLIAICRNAKDDFAALFVIGVIVFLFAQIVLNVGVALGLLPVTGVTFPLVSYGGSSLLVSFILIGIVQSIVIRTQI
ncbi:MAG TPA: rod shape-determining protein RodA [Patescibacteria group bacterium]|nr:rod shape-determining protein RodA [Patescibacteria group bacterium]